MWDWKEIHQDFTPELQKEWEKWEFSAEQTKEWIEAGLQPAEADFAYWLKEVKYRCNNQQTIKKYQKWITKHGHDLTLWSECQEYPRWAVIHKDFGYYGNKLQNEWKNHGFTPQTTRPWMEKGLETKDYELATYARIKGYQPGQISKEKLAEEHKKWENNSKPVQEYLGAFYPLETRK